MTVPVTVSEHDLLGLLSIVSDHRADDPGDGLPLRKHLENIYARLQVSSRAAAVTRAFQGAAVAAAT
jgi:hypothetical protein